MTKYIESNKVVPLTRLLLYGVPEEDANKLCDAVQELVDTFAVDAVVVTRCRDCIHSNGTPRDMGGFFICQKTGGYMSYDDYCSYATRCSNEREGVKQNERGKTFGV